MKRDVVDLAVAAVRCEEPWLRTLDWSASKQRRLGHRDWIKRDLTIVAFAGSCPRMAVISNEMRMEEIIKQKKTGR